MRVGEAGGRQGPFSGHARGRQKRHACMSSSSRWLHRLLC